MTARMPFGQYRGRLLSEIPEDYLDWLASLSNLREPLRSRVRREHERRFGRDADPRPCLPHVPEQIRIVAEKIVTRGFRALATEHHPDHGGEHGRMLELNAAHEALVGLLRGIGMSRLCLERELLGRLLAE